MNLSDTVEVSVCINGHTYVGGAATHAALVTVPGVWLDVRNIWYKGN